MLLFLFSCGLSDKSDGSESDGGGAGGLGGSSSSSSSDLPDPAEPEDGGGGLPDLAGLLEFDLIKFLKYKYAFITPAIPHFFAISVKPLYILGDTVQVSFSYPTPTNLS